MFLTWVIAGTTKSFTNPARFYLRGKGREKALIINEFEPKANDPKRLFLKAISFLSLNWGSRAFSTCLPMVTWWGIGPGHLSGLAAEVDFSQQSERTTGLFSTETGPWVFVVDWCWCSWWRSMVHMVIGYLLFWGRGVTGLVSRLTLRAGQVGVPGTFSRRAVLQSSGWCWRGDSWAAIVLLAIWRKGFIIHCAGNVRWLTFYALQHCSRFACVLSSFLLNQRFWWSWKICNEYFVM